LGGRRGGLDLSEGAESVRIQTWDLRPTMLASVSLKTELSVLGSEAGITRGRRIEGAVCAARSHIQGIRLPLARRNAGKQYLFCVKELKTWGV